MNSTVPATTPTSEPCTVVVAGDICLDVLGLPIPPAPLAAGSSEENWRQTGETRTFYRRGGTWLLADLLRSALKAAARSATLIEPIAPGVTEDDFEKFTRQQIVHSLLILGRYTDKLKQGDCECEEHRVRVAESQGFSGPTKPAYASLSTSLIGDTASPDLVVLDDTGNRFRHDRTLWPKAITNPTDSAAVKPLVLYKLHRPLPGTATNDLWNTIRQSHRENTVVVVSVDDLREAGAVISRKLSWERTALELVWQLNGSPDSSRLSELRSCAHLIIRLGLDGAIYWCNPGGEDSSKSAPRAWLIYDPAGIEGASESRYKGQMVGYGSAFVSGLAATLTAASAQSDSDRIRSGKARAECEALGPSARLDDHLPSLVKGIKQGLFASRQMLAIGYLDPTNGPHPDCRYPVDALFETAGKIDENSLATITIPLSTHPLESDPHSWSILTELLPQTKDQNEAAEATALYKKPEKVNRTLARLPRGVFGKLTTFDRSEIESYRAISNVVGEYLKLRAPKRPLCLAVFGPPGSGKSFGVEEVANSLAKSAGAEILKLTFNLSQFEQPQELSRVLHLVRDAVLKGKTPLVFFDEFDSSVGTTRLFWLKYLLAPMQDGEFLDQGTVHPIGRAIFVFAGGTSGRYADFVPRQFDSSGRETTAWSEFRLAKGPDFVSRLRGVLNIPGIEISQPQARGAALLRRAGVLRFQLNDKAKHLFDTDGKLQIDPGLLRAILQVRGFHHGIRSLEALLDMSQLAGKSRLDPGSLPHPTQMGLHVDVADFMSLLHTGISLATQREEIARALHNDYLANEEREGRLNPAQLSHRPWESLTEDARESNRLHADDIPRNLQLAGFYLRKGATSPCHNPPFDQATIEIVAKAEHDRWMRERFAADWNYGDVRDNANKIHPDLVPWDKLKPDARNKDIRFAEFLPELLGKLGWEIVRLP